jgi:protein gp37
MQNRFRKWNGGEWGPHAPRKRTSEANWRKPLQWNKRAQADGIRLKVFCASLADWLDNKAPQSWRVDLAALIQATPNLDWLLLTKRIENYERFASWSKIPPNVWLGVTCENQLYYNRRWPILSRIDARVRFISYEPALGPLELNGRARAGIPDWVICGGESGAGARMMKRRWARSLRDECEELSVAFFMKQMTGRKQIPADLLIRDFPEI